MTETNDTPHCGTPPRPVPPLPASLPPARKRAIVVGSSKWANGTVLRYAFYDGADPVRGGPDAQLDVVRISFQTWLDLELGLGFEEVSDLAEAEVRIGFDQSDGSWSAVGRDVLLAGGSEATMNFGWDLTTPYGRSTALHEIGHTLGMPHEHQSPFSGIVWDEEAVYEDFAGSPNTWSRADTKSNVLDKLDPAAVEGSTWDPDSIMEYRFKAGLIREPAAYADGITPPGTITELDAKWMRYWYPRLEEKEPLLQPFASTPLPTEAHEQANFAIVPPASREYELGTFGSADTVAVLFEEIDGDLRFLGGDDDSGEERNARLKVKLFQGRRYVLRVRVNWVGAAGAAAVMYW